MQAQTISVPGKAVIGPYVLARKAGNIVFVSGQIGIDSETKKLGDTFEDQVLTRLRSS